MVLNVYTILCNLSFICMSGESFLFKWMEEQLFIECLLLIAFKWNITPIIYTLRKFSYQWKITVKFDSIQYSNNNNHMLMKFGIWLNSFEVFVTLKFRMYVTYNNHVVFWAFFKPKHLSYLNVLWWNWMITKFF